MSCPWCKEHVPTMMSDIARLTAENAAYRAALEDIAYPIAKFQRDVDASNGEKKLDVEMAIRLSESADYLKGIALAALTPQENRDA